MILLPVQLEELRTFDLERQIDIVLDAFESSWKKGMSPSAMEYAKVVEPQHQKRLLRELILVERELFNFLGAPKDSTQKADSPTVKLSTSETVPDSEGNNAETDSDQPTHFDRFAIIRLLGRGSHGKVYEAEDLEIRRRVALKIAYSSDGNVATREFATEAANASRVSHPSVVGILEVGEHRGIHFMVSELIEGSSLRQYQTNHSLDDITCSQIVADVAAGINAAHKAGVIHRDLKPSNIMIQCLDRELGESTGESPTNSLNDRLRVRILDFGIAKMLDRLTQRTVAGDIVGTPHYMSPEQASGNSANVDQRSDIFSLGVIYFELLCGRLPFEGSDITVVAGIRDLKVPSIRSIRSDIPTALEKIVHKCLERQPSHRYQSAAALETDLRKWIAGGKPLVLRQHEQKRYALGSILIATACMTVYLACIGIGNGWFATSLEPQNRSLNAFASIGTKNDSSDPKTSTVQSDLAAWLERGLPQSLVEWLGNVDMDNSKRLVELNARRPEPAQEDSHGWRWRLAQVFVARDSVLQDLDLKRLAKEFIANFDPSQAKGWEKALGSAPDEFVLELEDLVDRDLERSQRQPLFGVIANRWVSSDQEAGLLRLLKIANTDELTSVVSALMECAKRPNSSVEEMLIQEFESTELKTSDALSTEEASRWRAKLALIAYGIEDWERVDRALSYSVDPRSRSYFIYWFKKCGFALEPLLDRFESYRDDWRSTAVLACLSTFPDSELDEETYRKSNDLLSAAYKEHPSSGVHSAAKALLISRGLQNFVHAVDALGDSALIKNDRNWYLNSEGMQMNIIRGPVKFWFGKSDREPYKPGRFHSLKHSFAVSNEVVSKKHYSRFDPTTLDGDSDLDATGISLTEAVSYCDWLSEKEGLGKRKSISPIDEESFQFNESEQGYRLLTVWEWECFARYATITAFSHGEAASEFIRTNVNAASASSILFGPGCDLLKKTPEWTATTMSEFNQSDKPNVIKPKEMFVVKGGLSRDSEFAVPLSEMKIVKPSDKKSVGFRITRTIQ